MQRRLSVFFFIALLSYSLHAQDAPVPDVAFDFNDHTFGENHGRLKAKPVGVSLVEDRFDNPKSALYLHGNFNSYLNLGTDPLLKPKVGTISLWVKLDRKVFAGKGYESNPIIITKNSRSLDFYDAYALFYDLKSERFMTFTSEDSTGARQAGVNSTDPVEFNKWYHLAVAYNNDSIAFYINGVLQGRSKKGFETKFLVSDSVVVGNGACTKNDRWSRGTVDDIRIFHRVLSEGEIGALYNEPNPNKFRNTLNTIGIYVLFLLITGGIVMIVIWRYRKVLQRQKEQYELRNKINELEMRVIKAQMNPHFISNCLAAIQELIYNGQVDKAGQYIAKFSFFLRQVLNYSDQTYITLKEELDIIRLNVELEQLRFKDNFDFILNLDDKINMAEVAVPSLITQPFVENAVWHGLLQIKDGRRPRLQVNVYSRNNLLFIEVEDNGVGRGDIAGKESRQSKGTKLAMDKLESINKLTDSTNYKLEIVDLKDDRQAPCGTRIIIQLFNYTH